jgi:archaemetzincin
MIEIVAFDKIEGNFLHALCRQIQEILRMPCDVSDKILEVPLHAFNVSRRQYDSRFFLQTLQEYVVDSEAKRVLGITIKDLYAGTLNFIFGQAHIGGRVCVVSLHRLDPAFYGSADVGLFLERTVKEAVHELGHCLGLRHCDNRKCVMVFSNSIVEVDEKGKNFCKRCEEKIW